MKSNKTSIYGYARISNPTQSIERQIRNIEAAYKDAFIVREVFTGTKQERPEWIKLTKAIKAGSIIVFDSVSRMSRNAEEGLKEYFELYDRGVDLIFLKEPLINTSVYRESSKQNIQMTGNDIADIYIEATNKVLKIIAKKQIQLAFEQSEKEVADLHKRTSEGIETARLNGKQIGQKKGNTLDISKKEPIKALIKKLSREFSGTNTDKQVMSILKDEYIYIPLDKKKEFNISKLENVKKISAEISWNTYYKYKQELKNDTNNIGLEE